MRYPVFVLGSPRSGTSVLVDALMVAGYHGFREGHFLPLIAKLEQMLELHFKYLPVSHEVLSSNIDRAELSRRLFAVIYQMTDALHRTPWFDKTGDVDMLRSVPTISELWPQSVFVFARRRGIENVLSRLKKFPDYPLATHAALWAEIMKTWRSIREKLQSSRFIEIDQQSMLQRPEFVADQLSAFLQLDQKGRDDVLSTFRHGRPEEAEKGSAERRWSLASTGWSESEIKMFLDLCGDEIESYGYSLDESYFRDASAPAL